MDYRHIHYLKFEPGVHESIILDSAVALANQSRDDKFLLKAASFICRHTEVEYVGIAVLTNNKKTIKTCILLEKNKVMDNMEFPIQGTPCDEVFIHRFCYYPKGVADNFPTDVILKKLKIESYLGTILLDKEGEPIGVIQLMDKKTIKNPAFAEHLILVLSPAIEEELYNQISERKIA